MMYLTCLSCYLREQKHQQRKKKMKKVEQNDEDSAFVFDNRSCPA